MKHSSSSCYVAEGVLSADQETEETVFQLLATGLSGYLKPEAVCEKMR